MNDWGEWAWPRKTPRSPKLSDAERAYRKRVTRTKDNARRKERHRHEAASRREIKRLNDLPPDHFDRKPWGQRYLEALRELEREQARQLGRKVNPEIGRRRALAMARATPPWANPKEMVRIYAKARRLSALHKTRYHVDHIVPVQSKWVCGLNCEANLQIMPAMENIRKGNRRWPDMPDSFIEQRLAHKSLCA